MNTRSMPWDIGIASVLQKNPDDFFFRGNHALLERPAVSIVGSRTPTPYTRQITFELASKLAKQGIVVVSGAAMGVDAIAHQGAGPDSTIAVMGNGLDISYPKVNEKLIASIEKEGLCISPYEDGFRPTRWSFVQRNEIVAALGDVLVVMQADLQSGSLHSATYALKMGKPVYVIPHRMGESEGTNQLLKVSQARCIYDIDEFVNGFAPEASSPEDALLVYCKHGKPYDEVVSRFGELVFSYELDGKIVVHNGVVTVA